MTRQSRPRRMASAATRDEHHCSLRMVLFCFGRSWGPPATASHSGRILMNSTMIGKIEKAHRYAEEPDRVKFRSCRQLFAAAMTTTM